METKKVTTQKTDRQAGGASGGNPVKRARRTTSQGAIAREAAGAAAGGVVGAVFGMTAGPAGAMAGAAFGMAAGAALEAVMEKDAAGARRHDAELDEEIGVTGGDIGAPNLAHPKPRVGAYSVETSGAAQSTPTPAEGPLPPPAESD